MRCLSQWRSDWDLSETSHAGWVILKITGSLFIKKQQNRLTQIHREIIEHIQAYSGVIHAYSEPCVTLAVSEFCFIQNPDMFKTRRIFWTKLYPKLCYIHNKRLIQNPGLFNPGIFRTGAILRTLSDIYEEHLRNR